MYKANEFSESFIEKLKAFLAPIGKDSDEAIAELQRLAYLLDGTDPVINTFVCKNGHETVTIDRQAHKAPAVIQCPGCKAEARSLFYFCDQQQEPIYEFYKPRDPMAFPRHIQRQLRAGGLVLKKIGSEEPVRLSTRLKASL